MEKTSLQIFIFQVCETEWNLHFLMTELSSAILFPQQNFFLNMWNWVKSVFKNHNKNVFCVWGWVNMSFYTKIYTNMLFL